MQTVRESVVEALASEERAEKPSAAALAAMLGVSRQRVYQIIREEALTPGTLGRGGPRRPEASDEDYPPDERAGGVFTDIHNHSPGTTGELLVAADLLGRGYFPFTPVSGGSIYDVIAVRRNDGTVLTFEVRTTKRLNGRLRRPKQSTHRKGGRADGAKPDYYAFVVRGEPVLYDPELPAGVK